MTKIGRFTVCVVVAVLAIIAIYFTSMARRTDLPLDRAADSVRQQWKIAMLDKGWQ